MIKQKLDEGDIALLEIIEDSIFCAEFMRTTLDLSANKSVWLKEPFKYRWYQRDLITDKSEYVVLTGGRSIGKCQPRNARVYTDHGYRSIADLLKQKCFLAYCLNDNGELVKRRAVVTFDQYTTVYKIRTKTGHEIFASGNHPIHTPNGYKLAELLTLEDSVSVVTHLPYDNPQSYLRHEELRYLGYIYLNKSVRPESGFIPRFKQIKIELQKLCELLNMTYSEGTDGHVYLRRRKGYGKHPLAVMMYQLDMAGFYMSASYNNGAKIPRRLSKIIKSECNENTQIFLEALLAQSATFTKDRIILETENEITARDLQELFLRHGIETMYDEKGTLQTVDARAAYRVYTQFDIPGVSTVNLQMPPTSFDYHPSFRYDSIQSIEIHSTNSQTYAIYVYDYHNYITNNVLVHNSLVLEDKILVDIINNDLQYPQETRELLFTTANQAQIEPILSRVVRRSTTSPILKEALAGRVNRSSGVLDFRFNDVQFIMRARIAGGNKESNIVGLHIPKIIIDEGQLYLLGAFTQLMPTLNQWQTPKQMFIAGVSNGLRNSALYQTSVKSGRYKWYRVPSHNNPYYSRDDDIENIKRYGGMDTDEYQQLVLGKHGTAAFSVITRDQMMQKPYAMYGYSFTGTDVSMHKTYQQVLDLPPISGKYSSVVFGVDTGYVDPTIICVMVLRENGTWEIHARYKLVRIDFPMQEQIIDWLDTFYKPDKIGIDAGAGGGGTQMLHSFLYRDPYTHKRYADRITPVTFNERIAVGYDSDGKELVQLAKALGASNLVQLLQQHSLVLSELDQEAVSQLERITRQRGIDGNERYYILSEKGNGPATDDHLFAALICFAITIRDLSFMKKRRKKLGKASGK